MPETMNILWTWISPSELEVEKQQVEDEGRDISRVRRKFDEMLKLSHEELAHPGNQIRAGNLLDACQRLPMRRGYEFVEPSDFAGIRRARSRRRVLLQAKVPPKEMHNCILGAWLGRCIGCLLGKPVEGVQYSNLRRYLEATGQWPLNAYIRFSSSKQIRSELPKLGAGEHLHGLIAEYDAMQHMPVDDDTNYTTAGLLIAQRHGSRFVPMDVARFWLQNLPLEATCTAERVAYRNFAMNIAPPDSASHRNPFREWIGAQIRADAFGYVAAGDPELAADLAWRDASISHVKNGIYGEMMVASAIAAAPMCESTEEALRAGMAQIPAKGRLYTAILEVFDWRAEGIGYEDAIARVHARWNETSAHHWCHTISNAVICAIALLWGEDDFGKSICRAVAAGFDTDCNGATVGSIFGMLHGAQSIGPEWTAKLNNTLKTSMAGYEHVAIDSIAHDNWKVWRSIRQR